MTFGLAWLSAGTVVYSLGSVAALATAAGLVTRRERFGSAGNAIIIALFMTAIWAIAAGTAGPNGFVANLAEAFRNLALLLLTLRLFGRDGRDASVGQIRSVVVVLVAIEALQLALGLMAMHAEVSAATKLFQVTVLFRLLVAVGSLVLVHNLYLGASPQARLVLRWPASALAVIWAFDLNLYTIAYLGNRWPAELASARGLSVIAFSFLVATGAARGREALRLRPSRAVAFQSVSLMLIGAYLLTMFAVAQWLAYAGGDFARLMELGFFAFAAAIAIVLLPSARLRRRLRVMVTKHLFQHRYDYRAEWLRFNQTIGQSAESHHSLEERTIKAVADIADSPAGLLLVPADSGGLCLAARWQWATAEVPAMAMSASEADFFEKKGFIADLDDLRSGHITHGVDQAIPDWLRAETRAWAVVPLVHYDRLMGLVVLARADWGRTLDWEDFDLLRVVGQQLGSYLAEHAGQQALIEASRFDDFNRRIAFVMHDIKNLASQLGLLARNAELHADNPAFRSDMLLTLRNSADKLNALLARLSRYGPGSVQQLVRVDGRAVMESMVARFRAVHPVMISDVQDCWVMADVERLEQALVHLVQNAADASDADKPISLSLWRDAAHGRIDVQDQGCGMSAEYVRNQLFKPFISSKSGGFGIGAFEARELVRSMGGTLEVESREGLGSRFSVRLPLAQSSSQSLASTSSTGQGADATSGDWSKQNVA